jgi:formylmethanofuran dehydrogenase subunit E
MIDEQTLGRVVEFHGHLCPGVAMGVQAAQIAP